LLARRTPAQVRTLEDIYRGTLAQTSFAVAMLSIAAVMALLLSVVGIYSVLSYAVTQRARELAIRTALGAPKTALRAMFVRDGLRLTLAGLGIGLAAAALLGRTMSSMLFGVASIDWVTYAATGIVLALAAALASSLPAYRATSRDPLRGLRAS
jgi:ABC-type antimicrobial peptide transport system permease subunit